MRYISRHSRSTTTGVECRCVHVRVGPAGAYREIGWFDLSVLKHVLCDVCDLVWGVRGVMKYQPPVRIQEKCISPAFLSIMIGRKQYCARMPGRQNKNARTKT